MKAKPGLASAWAAAARGAGGSGRQVGHRRAPALSYSTPSPRCALAQTHKHRCYRRRRLPPLQGRKPPADGRATVMFCDLVESTGIAAKLNVKRSHPLMQS